MKYIVVRNSLITRTNIQSSIQSSIFSSAILSLVLILCSIGSMAYSAVECEPNCARNRNDVLAILGTIESNWPAAQAGVWVNSNEREPIVKVGERVAYTMHSFLPAYYTMIYIDSKGDITILKPDGLQNNRYKFPAKMAIFPALTEQCPQFKNQPECFDPDTAIDQGEPVGRDTVILLASRTPLENSIFEIPNNREFAEIGRNLNRIKRIQKSLNTAMDTAQVDVNRYSYTVEADTQYTTRAIRRKISNLEAVAKEESKATKNSLVFNNINFQNNSFDLMPSAKRELDALGSALVDIQRDGNMPLIVLTGHTDSNGTELYNQRLSERRAMAAKFYLESEHGITESNLISEGAGESTPMMENDSDWSRSQNRRVELSIIPR